MNKNELTIGTQLIEKKPSKHTTKLHEIVIKGIYTGYSYSNKRSYTYYICMTKQESYYPAANCPQYLDGLMGDYTLTKLKKEYTIK